MVQRYKVWSHKPRYFDTLKEARAFAERYYVLTGYIVAVTVTLA